MLGVVLLAVVVLHLPALRAPFFADDFLFLDHAARHSLRQSLSGPDAIGDFYRPLARQLWFEGIGALGRSGPLVAHAANLLLALISITLLWLITRRLAGPIAATAAAMIFAFHYAFDVPILWALGSQDLLALTGALAAILLFMERQARLAAVALFAALLSKESVAAAAAVAILAGRSPNERWSVTLKRAQPLLVAVGVWVALYAYAIVRGVIVPGGALHFDLASPFAAVLQFPRVALGLEWRPGFEHVLKNRVAALWPVGIVLVLATLALKWDPWARAPRVPGARRAAGIAVLWTIAGILPVMLVARDWSAYFYLFALAGFAVFAGVVCAGVSRPVGVAIAAALVLGSVVSRELDAFATRAGPWTSRSHVNRQYLVHGAERVARDIRELRAARPSVERGTTFFFTATPEFAGFQVGDGPLVRWIYSDTTLRSYFLSELTTQRARRGPALFFAGDERGLREIASNAELRQLAVSVVHGEKLEQARDALTLVLERFPADPDTRYWRAWTHLALGDTASATEDLERIGFRFGVELKDQETGNPETDSLRMIRDLVRDVRSAPFDVRRHARLADLALLRPEWAGTGAVEAFAARVLAPNRAAAWRRWGAVLVAAERLEMAVPALERAVALSEKPDPGLSQELERIRRAIKQEPLAAREPRAPPSVVE